ncbi:PREDICTED: solute carrier family 10 member 6-like [Branchiostoma belcheri]|uniref:Solute carrier family 10 member 6-like n=1 Tax=Branchiostoma belcheri TaxID=7741 RepID=A0A6P4Z4X6_BRABE|nr:PREDICTED: solute carrier family 10 member 6-like [Branchiostoma belcheri]
MESRLESDQTVDLATRVMFTVTSAVLMLALGCTVQLEEFFAIFHRPRSVLLCLLSQYVAMPLILWGLVAAFSLDGGRALSILLMACCPTAGLANVVTYWVDGDKNLSIYVTTVSTLLCLVTIPVCLAIFTSTPLMHGQQLAMAIDMIAVALVCVLVPVIVGILLQHYCKKIADVLGKLASYLGGLLLISSIIVATVIYRAVFRGPTGVLVIAAVFPPFSLLFGYAWAVAFKEEAAVAKTVAVQTGNRNVSLCLSVLKLAFHDNVADQILTFPIEYWLIQNAFTLLVALLYHTWKTYRSPASTGESLRILGEKVSQHSDEEEGEDSDGT